MARASVPDTLAAATVLAPIVAQGVMRRPRMVALADRLEVDHRAGRVLARLRGRYGPGPLRLRVPGRSVALVLAPADVQRVLEGSPEPFAVASREKRGALRHFQPDGLLVSAIEQGKHSPSLEVAFRIARVFAVPLEQVFQYPDGGWR